MKHTLHNLRQGVAIAPRVSRRAWRSNRGVALIMVLGIMALLLILVMAFAFDAQSTSQVAHVMDDHTRSRSMARGGLERALAFVNSELGEQTADNTFLAPGVKFYQPPSGNWAGGRYLATVDPTFDTGVNEAFHLSVDGYDLTPTDATTGLPGVGWSRIYSYTDVSTDGSSNMDTTIVGRMAYLIIDETGKADVGAWVDTAVDDGQGFIGTRTGTSPTELQVYDLLLDGDAARRYHPADHSAYTGALPAGLDWLSRQMQVGGVVTSQAEADLLTARVLPLGTSEPEEYWLDADSDSQVDLGELVARLDLTNVGPDGSAGQITAPELYDHFLGVSTGNTSRDSMAYISPWLKSKNPADMAEARRIAAQVALNMVDYVDTDSDDSDPVTGKYQPDVGYIGLAADDYALTVSGNSAPVDPAGSASGVVHGFEDTYYLAGLGIHPNFSWVLSDLLMTPQFKVWLQRPSGDTTEPHDLRVKLSIKCTLENSIGLTLTQSASGYVYKSQMVGAAPNFYTASWQDLKTDPTSISIVLSFANITGALHTLLWGIETIEITEVVVEVQDTAASDWRVAQSLPAHSEGTTETSQFVWGEEHSALNLFGVILGYYKFYTAKDPGHANVSIHQSDFTDYWDRLPNDNFPGIFDLSGFVTVASTYNDASKAFSDVTAPNTPFTSWKDLGRVHAYERERSLRLWGNVDGLTYTDHDCYLYDMFKIGSHETMKGRVNINSPHPAVAYALNGWDSHTGNIDDNLVTVNGSTGGRPLMYRGDLCKTLFDVADAARRDSHEDDTAEEEFGHWMDYTTTRSNYFTIVVCAQALKDLGTLASPPPGALQWDTVNNKWCTVTAETKLMAYVYRDAWTGDFKILRVNYLQD